MRILLSGSTGLIGRHLAASLRHAGTEVVPLVRRETPGAILWDPESTELSPEAVSGFDAVIHLAGEPVGSGRWTAAKKQAIHHSRVRSTELLAGALARAPNPPRLFLCASGINFYGDRGNAVLDETQPKGEGFLADVCEAWEAAPAPLHGLARVVSLRIGIVLAADGGTLPTMLPLFRLGLGGPIAGGGNFVSWITLRDLIRAIHHLLAADRLSGPVNLVASHPVSHREFTAALAAALRKPARVPVPAWVVRTMLGQLAEETVLSSLRVVPARLLADGFRFEDPEIGPALQSVLQPTSG